MILNSDILRIQWPMTPQGAKDLLGSALSGFMLFVWLIGNAFSLSQTRETSSICSDNFLHNGSNKPLHAKHAPQTAKPVQVLCVFSLSNLRSIRHTFILKVQGMSSSFSMNLWRPTKTGTPSQSLRRRSRNQMEGTGDSLQLTLSLCVP